LRATAARAYASVQAKRVYTVELDWSGPQRDGFCTCPHAAEGHFCKHLVAVGLAVIDSGAVDDATQVASALEATVQAMEVDELRELVMSLARRDGEVRRMLEVRATAASGDDTTAKAEFASLCAKRPGSPRIRRLSRVLRGRGGRQPSPRSRIVPKPRKPLATWENALPPLPGSSGRRFKSCQPDQEKSALTCDDRSPVR